jgi:glyoxylase-like metal-dependent hydrolase (beta-lactamase superfamily II)
MLRIDSVIGNSQQLDGGAMFGNCPRALWSRWCPPDDSNRIALNCRGLLVREESGRAILFETGVGAFFEPTMRERYGVREAQHVLLQSLAEIGVAPEEVDVIVLSHLHFDHAGGILEAWREGQGLKLAFANAHYVVGDEAFERAMHPHPRDHASFIAGLPALLEATGRLERVTGSTSETLGDGYRFHFADGHTPGLMMARIETDDPGPINFVSDLIPGVPWIHAPITMGYDRFPELLIDEKMKTLDRVLIGNEWLFLTHDPSTALCQVECDERGRYSASDERALLRSSD